MAGASSSGAGALPIEAPSAQFAALAQQLGRLELQRDQVQARIDEVREARLAGARGAGGSRSSNEINILQGRVHGARSHLHRLLARRDAQIDALDCTRRLLASCERSLAALSLAPAAPAVVAAKTPVPTPSSQAAQSPWAAPVTTEEAAARQHMQQLERQREALKLEQDRLARDVVAPARAEVRRLTAEAEEILEPTSYMARIESSVRDNLNSRLAQRGLPLIDAFPSGLADERFERYLEHFTEAGAGARRLKEEYLATGTAAFFALSALYGAMVPNKYVRGLLWRVLQGPMDDALSANGSDRMLRRQMEPITAALRSGAAEALEAAVIRQVEPGFDSCMFSSAQMASVSVRHGGAGPRRAVLQRGGAVSRNEVIVTAERNETLLLLQQVPEHREAIVLGAVTQAAAMVTTLAREHADAMAEVRQAQGSLDQAQKELRGVVVRGVDVAQEITAVREQVKQFVEERRRLEAAEANKGARRPSEAAIPQTETAGTSSSLDPEARGMKLRGDIQGHREKADQAEPQITDLEGEVRQARAELRGCEDQLEATAAAHARGAAGARRQFDALGDKLASLRGEIRALDLDIQHARTELRSHFTRNAVISARAWDRAAERHVLLDDAALRARARETGRAGAYDSHAGMALAVAEIHAHVSQRPDLQAVLAARTHAEFDRAIAALPDGVSVTDAVFDHGRPVGRGFSNAPGQTGRPTVLTQSSYSLDFEPEGRVAVSHVYPRAGI